MWVAPLRRLRFGSILPIRDTPCEDVLCRIHIGVRLMPAVQTMELGLCLAIPGIHHTANRTSIPLLTLWWHFYFDEPFEIIDTL